MELEMLGVKNKILGCDGVIMTSYLTPRDTFYLLSYTHRYYTIY